MSIDIFIKSCNRPYYLERCIRSIYQYIEGSFTIKVMDDGTAPEYLHKISRLFPSVIITTSPFHDQKWKALKDHVAGVNTYSFFKIPTAFWIAQIREATPYFLLLEDDSWLIQTIRIESIVEVMSKEQMVKLKLSWQGNASLNQGKRKPLQHEIEQIKPKISLFNEMMLTNRLGIWKVLSIDSVKGFKALLPFYSIYYVASAFFEKEYWLYLWQGAGKEVDEKFQLKRALSWYKTQKSKYGKLVQEKAKTSYISSATNTQPAASFDMNYFNYHINEAWLKGDIDVMENSPNDFSKNYLRRFLAAANQDRCTVEGWEQWISQFKANYEKLGCVVD